MLRRHSSGYDFLFFLTILVTLLALAPALAHLFELPRKMMLDRHAYFTVQQIYAGWNLFGVVIVLQLLLLVLLAWRSAGEYYVFRPVLVALLMLGLAQAVFWLFTFPANAATHNWTVIVPDWQALRHQWEYSHAIGAGCQSLGICALVWALFARVRAGGR
jgi:hypothetical protein